MKQDQKHLEMVRSLPCVVCAWHPTIAHHVRSSWNAGMGIKPESIFTLPLCNRCHRELHDTGENRFWEIQNINQYEEIMKVLTRREKELPF